MSSQVLNHIHMAILCGHISTIRSAMDTMGSQVMNHVRMAILSCQISTIGSTVAAMSMKISNHIQMASRGCPRSEEQKTELQSLQRNSIDTFCLTQKTKK